MSHIFRCFVCFFEVCHKVVNNLKRELMSKNTVRNEMSLGTAAGSFPRSTLDTCCHFHLLDFTSSFSQSPWSRLKVRAVIGMLFLNTSISSGLVASKAFHVSSTSERETNSKIEISLKPNNSLQLEAKVALK